MRFVPHIIRLWHFGTRLHFLYSFVIIQEATPLFCVCFATLATTIYVQFHSPCCQGSCYTVVSKKLNNILLHLPTQSPTSHTGNNKHVTTLFWLWLGLGLYLSPRPQNVGLGSPSGALLKSQFWAWKPALVGLPARERGQNWPKQVKNNSERP